MAIRIREAFEQGWINTMSWHMMNPVTGGSHNDNDTTAAVKAILSGTTGTAKIWPSSIGSPPVSRVLVMKNY